MVLVLVSEGPSQDDRVKKIYESLQEFRKNGLTVLGYLAQLQREHNGSVPLTELAGIKGYEKTLGIALDKNIIYADHDGVRTVPNIDDFMLAWIKISAENSKNN